MVNYFFGNYSIIIFPPPMMLIASCYSYVPGCKDQTSPVILSTCQWHSTILSYDCTNVIWDCLYSFA